MPTQPTDTNSGQSQYALRGIESWNKMVAGCIWSPKDFLICGFTNEIPPG